MELSFLRPMYERPGPWVSVYLDASRDTEDARPALDLRWRALRDELLDQRAAPAAVAALDDVIRGHDPMPGDYGLAAFASDDRITLTEYLDAPPARDLASHGPLAHAMPLVAQRGEQIPWVRVLADRTGADVDAVSAGGVARRARVTGSDQYPIRRVKPGAWSQANYQREAMTAWQRNAGDAAAATAELADRIGAEVVVVAGDPQARSMLAAALPARWQSRIVQTEAGSRADGADPRALDDVTAQAVAEVAEAHANAALDRFGSQERIGEGLAAVVAALQRGQVETMLIVDDPSSTDRLWIGPEPTEIAVAPDELAAMAVTEPQRVRADAALLRALVGTDAGLTVLGPDEAPELTDGVGAVLRYADAGTPGRDSA
ncbi:Vms1/Ankzf1 family peptidyl-tRNA hydrolase [Solwaraspora sp. WMMD1047]|uniref:baeRF2 domain-containing protein n=1 Tax=Solwaraspora sp. WMMD1047 TaxID=3016102 RepID=UPI0024177E17|nr:Vms1/Ankzf1 family peptidyl-tRNA hydrolase [Solwaraspora sp. WMMD1047]MDG4831275.1 Vms1/Ankzf1 family peptidyl-tRNA hydrolase [Solwaraspora sp. WMMD1047]